MEALISNRKRANMAILQNKPNTLVIGKFGYVGTGLYNCQNIAPGYKRKPPLQYNLNKTCTIS